MRRNYAFYAQKGQKIGACGGLKKAERVPGTRLVAVQRSAFPRLYGPGPGAGRGARSNQNNMHRFFGLWRVCFPPCLRLVRPGRRLPVQGLSEGSLGFRDRLPAFPWEHEISGSGLNFTGRIAAGPDGHCAERDPNQSFRTMFFIFPHSAGQRPKGAFGGGGGNITPQV